MVRVSILCKASHNEGLGHLKRQVHLATALRDGGADISFYIKDYPPALEILTDHQIPYTLLGDYTKITEKLTTTVDLLILDIHDTDASWIRELRSHARKIAGFEDLGSGRNHLDLLIDCNLKPYDRNAHLEKVRTLFGWPYVLLHPEFETYHRRPKIFPEKISSVLVTLGGTDPCQLTLPVAEAIITARPSITLTLLAGPGYTERDSLEGFAKKQPQVRLLSSISNLAEILFSHDAIFCSGGITLFETLCVGTPAFVVSQVDHQARQACALEAQGAAFYLGSAESWDPDCMERILALEPSSRRSMSRSGKSLVDGRGLKRILEELFGLLV
jgi:spore coat polysaccharide biosynthesis predicted glycosyltransferase SpsG